MKYSKILATIEHDFSKSSKDVSDNLAEVEAMQVKYEMTKAFAPYFGHQLKVTLVGVDGKEYDV